MVLRMNTKRLYQKLRRPCFRHYFCKLGSPSSWNQQLTTPRTPDWPTPRPEAVEVGLGTIILCDHYRCSPDLGFRSERASCSERGKRRIEFLQVAIIKPLSEGAALPVCNRPTESHDLRHTGRHHCISQIFETPKGCLILPGISGSATTAQVDQTQVRLHHPLGENRSRQSYSAILHGRVDYGQRRLVTSWPAMTREVKDMITSFLDQLP